jgi:hypothetical protein
MYNEGPGQNFSAWCARLTHVAHGYVERESCNMWDLPWGAHKEKKTDRCMTMKSCLKVVGMVCPNHTALTITSWERGLNLGEFAFTFGRLVSFVRSYAQILTAWSANLKEGRRKWGWDGVHCQLTWWERSSWNLLNPIHGSSHHRIWKSECD